VASEKFFYFPGSLSDRRCAFVRAKHDATFATLQPLENYSENEHSA